MPWGGSCAFDGRLAGLPFDDDLLARRGFDDADGEGAGEVCEIPRDGRAFGETALGTAGGEVAGELFGVGDGFVGLLGGLGDVPGDGEGELGQCGVVLGVRHVVKLQHEHYGQQDRGR